MEGAALAILLFTYGLISFGRLGKNSVEMPSAALMGGALMLLAGIITPAEALASISWGTILLILGMMLIVAGMDLSGLFSWMSSKLAKVARTQIHFVVYVSLLTAFLSALILNDAVVLIFTPVVISSARKMRFSPVPPLVMEAISANIGSAATEVGNPQNAFIANVSGVEFHTFTTYLLPVALAALAFAVLYAVLLSRKDTDIHMEKAEDGREGGETDPPVFQLLFMAALVFSVFAAFYAFPVADSPFIAMTGGIISLFAIPLMTGRSGQEMFAKVDWGILLFFVGLFILIGGVASSGLLGSFVSGLSAADPALLSSVGGITLLSSLLSNLVSNVPAVLLLSPLMGKAANARLWLTLAASSTFAGNATIVGAAANVIVVRAAAKEGVRIRLAVFMKYGLPITVVSLLLTFLFLQLL